jgi:hypothetical protein
MVVVEESRREMCILSVHGGHRYVYSSFSMVASFHLLTVGFDRPKADTKRAESEILTNGLYTNAKETKARGGVVMHREYITFRTLHCNISESYHVHYRYNLVLRWLHVRSSFRQ